MTRHRTRLTGACAFACWLALPAGVLAQSEQPHKSSSGRKPGTYLKLGLAHWQGDIFSEGSLTQWSVDLFGADYNLTSLNLEFETYFRGAFLVSGLSLGYRKDAMRFADTGHMLSGMLFRDFNLKALALKAGGGVEWGIPSMNFDRTEFDYTVEGMVRYRHTYPGRNARLPVGVKSGGTMYPFFGLSAVQRPGPLLFEFGMRVNLMQFHFDDYEVHQGDQVSRVFDEHRVKVPYLFANIGLRLF
jgi:tetrahydromethanopterin S-methyltransferase subunit F